MAVPDFASYHDAHVALSGGHGTEGGHGHSVWASLADEQADSAGYFTDGATDTSHLSEVSPFLGSAQAPATYLDDLLEEADTTTASPRSHPLDGGSVSSAPFLSLDDDAGSPTSSSTTSASRLLQLENNYERKKKRAKINRKDLNSRFQELMDLLKLKEDRKLNRAKVLEKAVEHIEKLTAELKCVRAQLNARNVAAATSATSAASSSPSGVTSASQFHQNQHPQFVASTTMLRHPHAAVPMAFDPSQHNWGAPGMTPMMWVPCSLVASAATGSRTPAMTIALAAPNAAVAVAAASQPAPKKKLKRAREAMETTGSSTTSLPVAHFLAPVVSTPSTHSSCSSSPINSPACRLVDAVVTTPLTLARPSPSFVWIAQTIPTLLELCDAWTLASAMQTCREMAAAAQKDTLWRQLCVKRWQTVPSSISGSPRLQWVRWHQANRMPDCAIPHGDPLAAARAHGVSVWGQVTRRSNGRTTRTVLMDGKVSVMQVIELSIVLQNTGLGRVQLTDEISVSASDAAFRPFALNSGAHLTPHVAMLNGDPCAMPALKSVVLRHGDVCVLSVFLRCDGLDLEQQFMQRAEWMTVACLTQKQRDSSAMERVQIRARCVASGGSVKHIDR